jgi:type II secretory pathway pseudopilin PulG
LGILLAIAIPALTGYISKAQNQHYITQARDAAVALRSALDEDYVQGFFDEGSAQQYFEDGFTSPWPSPAVNKIFRLYTLSNIVYSGDFTAYYRKASILMGKTPFDDAPSYDTKTSAHWSFWFIGPKSTGATMVDATGFCYNFFPEGEETNSGKPFVSVTYNIKKIDPATIQHYDTTPACMINQTFITEYDPSAGYEVYTNLEQ